MRDRVAALLAQVFDDPERVLVDAEALMPEADPSERCQLRRVLGNACRELRRADDAVAHHEAALADAVELGDDRLEGLASMSLSATLTYCGDFDRALALVDRAVEALCDDEQVVALSQRAGILRRQGRPEEALVAFDAAFAAAETSTDPTIVGDVCVNRGVLLGLMGEIEAAEVDTRRALDIFLANGWTKRTADMQHNLAWLAGRRGDIIGSLRWFEEAEATYVHAGVASTSIFPDRCEVLVAAGLVTEAIALAERSADALDRLGARVDRAETLVLLARAALLAGDPKRASAAAIEAAETFAIQARTGWAAAAELLAIRADQIAGSTTESSRERALEIAEIAHRGGLTAIAVEARLVGAELALAAGDSATCAADLAALDIDSTSTANRFHARFLAAGVEVARGVPERALRICNDAMAEFDAWAGVLGGMELRAHVAVHARQISDLALELALAQGGVDAIVDAIERQRALTASAPPVHPPADRELELAVGEMRRSLLAIEDAAAQGYVDRAARRELALAQRRVRDRSRRLGGAAAPVADVVAATPGPDDTTRIAYARSSGRVVAVAVGPRGSDVVDVGAGDVVDRCVAALHGRLSLHLGALGRGDDPDPSALSASVDELDSLLVPDRVREAWAGHPASVICPEASLYDLPWGLLPSWRPVPFVVAPSFASHRRATRASTGRRTVAAVAGPGLEVAGDEVAAVRAAYAAGVALGGGAHDVGDVVEAMTGADVAHLACHGRFVADNPMFSSLDVGAGPLFVHELERLRPCPGVVVLSACHGGRHGAPTSAELLGVTVALLAAGARTVVSAAVQVPDSAATVAAMTELHRHLAAGVGAAEALLAVRRLDPIIGGAFCCHGAS